MLTERYAISCRTCGRQRGVVIVIVLIVLVAMTLAGIALMRSVNTTTLVAGNLAFKQAAVRAADIGTESAITFLKNNAGDTLNADIPANGYSSKQLTGPGSNQTWNDYWNASLDPHPLSRPVMADSNSGNAWTLATDQQGNTVSYVIDRMCYRPGIPFAANPPNPCTVTPSAADNAGNSKRGGQIPLQYASQVYYRITTRVDGPHNTVSFTQTIIAL